MSVPYRSVISSVIGLALLLNSNISKGQSFDQAASKAWVITRLAEKFHVQPRNMDDSFSSGFFHQLLDNLDPEHLFFNKSDLTQLAIYRLQLDDQVRQRKTDFLRLVSQIYIERLQQADSLIDIINRKPFDFSSAEKLTLAEDTAYPADISQMQDKFYKKMKLDVLSNLLSWNDQSNPENTSATHHVPDSLISAFQNHTHSVYKRGIKRILQSPGGIDQFLSDAYCKALASCYDPHTEFFPLTEKENFESDLGNGRFRFGFSIMEGAAGGVVINGLEPGSPAFKCGLLNMGDRFLALQWEGQKAIDVSNADASELSAILSESNHDKLVLTVKKADGSQRTVTLMKSEEASDEDNKVKSFVLKGAHTIGYISLPAFYSSWENADNENKGCANDVAREILKLKKDSIAGLIIDLRYNGSGAIEEAVDLTGIFIDAGPVAQIMTSTSNKVITLKDVNRGLAYTGPLIVLVNGYSASASELVAGSLQDYHRALIVGSTTYGKATGQVILPLDTTVNVDNYDGSRQADDYLKITTFKLFRVTGATAQFSGVKPDILLPELPQAHPQKEANEPFALLPSNIAPNPYYRPYPELPLGILQAMAVKDVDTMGYFIHLKNYTHLHGGEQAPTEVSLNWKTNLDQEKAEIAFPVDTALFSAPYSILNNTYDLDNLKFDSSSGDINSAFIRYLKHDPYLKICYDLINTMGK